VPVLGATHPPRSAFPVEHVRLVVPFAARASVKLTAGSRRETTMIW